MKSDGENLLLRGDDDDDEEYSDFDDEMAQGAHPQRKCGCTHGYSPLLIHIALIIINISLSLLYVHSSIVKTEQECRDRIFPITNAILKYEQTIFHNLSGSSYAGPPSPDVDSHWEALLAPMNMRVSRDELDAADQASVSLPDGGYMAWLGVYHALHCINMIRQWTYPDYYHENMTQAEREHFSPHIDHCIELLRQNAMCRPDLSLTTFKWDPHKTEPMFNASESVHTCVNWDRFTSSVAARVVSHEEYARLKNPLLG